MKSETRRDFVKKSLLAGAALSFPTACQFSSDKTSGISSEELDKLRRSLQGRIVLPTDEVYETARKVNAWNPLTDKRPAVIGQCVRPDDVARCVEFARKHDLEIAVRGGGHSNMGWGICQDGLVIDTSSIKGFSVDEAHRTMRIGAGSMVIEAVAAANPHGLAPVMAECATVGISGLTLGGGLSWLSGKYGATCDNLLSAEIITAEGQSVVASADQNPDLFWAIRGGGGNFGIATSFEYQLQPVSEVVAGGLTYRLEDAASMLAFFRDFMEEAPDELQAGAWLERYSETFLTLVLCCCGDLEKAEKIIRPLRTHSIPVQDTVKRRSFMETFNMTPDISDGVPRKFGLSNGTYVERLHQEAIEMGLEIMANAPDAGASIGLLHYMHGAVSRTAGDTTAFELRQPGAFQTVISGGWNDPADSQGWMDWTNEAWASFQSFSSGRTYSNFAGPEGKLAKEAPYGKNYPRLIEVKKKYDPNNIFRLNQNVVPS